MSIRLPITITLAVVTLGTVASLATCSAIVGRGNEQGYHLNADGLYVTGAPAQPAPTKAAAKPGANATGSQAQAATADPVDNAAATTAELDANLAQWYRAVGQQAYEREVWVPGQQANNVQISDAISYWLTTAPQQRDSSTSGEAALGVLDAAAGATNGRWSLKPLGTRSFNVATILKPGAWCQITGPIRYQQTQVRLPSRAEGSTAQGLWVRYRFYTPKTGTDGQGVWLVSVSDRRPSGC